MIYKEPENAAELRRSVLVIYRGDGAPQERAALPHVVSLYYFAPKFYAPSPIPFSRGYRTPEQAREAGLEWAGRQSLASLGVDA